MLAEKRQHRSIEDFRLLPVRRMARFRHDDGFRALDPSCEKSGQSGKFWARKARSRVALPAGSAGLKKGLVVESFELNEYLRMARSVWLM